MFSLLLSLMLGCGPTQAPEAPAAVAAPAPAAAPAEAAPPGEEAPPAPPPEVINADLHVALTRADGTAVTGKVKRIERSSDWYGEEGWSTETADLFIQGDAPSGTRKIAWADVKAVTVVPGKVPADVSCVYDSNYRPWMYDCTLKTTSTVTLKDGTTWTADNAHKWRFTFSDDQQVEFWLKKHPAREQDEKEVDIDTTNPENLDLYTKLQNRLRSEVKTSLVVKVVIH